MNGGNNRLRMTLKVNVGCLSLASEMNGGNSRLRMTLKLNVGCLSSASEINGGNIRLPMTLKINRRRSSEPSYHPIFGHIFDFEIFNHFDCGHSVQHNFYCEILSF